MRAAIGATGKAVKNTTSGPPLRLHISSVKRYFKLASVRVRVRVGSGLEEVFVFDSKSENRDRGQG